MFWSAINYLSKKSMRIIMDLTVFCLFQFDKVSQKTRSLLWSYKWSISPQFAISYKWHVSSMLQWTISHVITYVKKYVLSQTYGKNKEIWSITNIATISLILQHNLLDMIACGNSVIAKKTLIYLGLEWEQIQNQFGACHFNIFIANILQSYYERCIYR